MDNFKNLSVLRHGEAEYTVLKNGDFDRNLTAQGQSQVKKIREFLQKNEFEIDLVLSSSAKRTKETTKLVCQGTKVASVKFLKEIYEAQQDDLIRMINGLGKNINHLLIIGHNPGLSDLISRITGEKNLNLQPGMMAIMEIHVEDWSMVGKETGVLKKIIQ